MKVKPNHRAASVLEAAIEEVKKTVQGGETPQVLVVQACPNQQMNERLSAKGSVESVKRLSQLQ